MDEPAGDVLGREGVTRREAEVLDAVAERLTNAEVAARLHVSERTVESHVSSLLRKLGAHNRIDLASRAASRRGPGRRQFPQQLEAIARRGECVGRDAELQRLLACWERSAHGTAVAVVRGEAGIGKSRLAAAVAAEVHRRGGRVALGCCTDGPQRPYEPFAAILSHDRHIPSGASDVIDPDGERAAVQAALHEFLSQSAREHPLLFVIEDLHWGSSATRDAVAHLARVGGDAQLMLLVTIRDEELGAGGIGAFVSRIASLPSVEIVALTGLDTAAAALVIEVVGGDLDPAHAVWQTGGNPLFLRELARDGKRSQSLRELVAARFNRFCSSDLDVLDVATVTGEQIDVALVASTLERSIDDVLDTLERAEAVGLIGPGALPGRFAFTHDIFRSVRYASLTSSRRMRFHAAVARALGRRSADAPDIAERARHACLGGQRFDPAEAADLARRAGDAASEATDYGEAAQHYRRSLAALDLIVPGDDGACLDASIRLGASLVLVGDVDGVPMLEAAARAAHEIGEPVALARAICAMQPLPGGSTTTAIRDRTFRSLATAALDTLPPNEVGWHTRVLALLGRQLAATDAPEQGNEMVREALRAARQLGDPVAIGRVLLSYRFCGGPLELAERLACGTELVELGDRIGVELFSYIGCQQLWWCYRELGDRDQMDDWYAEATRRIRFPDVEQMSYAPSVALLDGDLPHAQRTTDVLSEAWDDTHIGRAYTAGLRTAIEDLRGRLPDPGMLERVFAAGTAYGEYAEALIARSWARSGRLDKAGDLLEGAKLRGFSLGHAPRGGAASACCWAEVAVSLDDGSSARELSALFEPVSGRLVDTGLYVSDTVDRVRALLRVTIGDAAEAADIAARAIAASRRRRTPILLARELIVLARAQQRLGVDTEDAIEEALAIARRTGARLIIHDARLYLATRGAGDAQDQFGLTRREREVVDLVASGASNSRIATVLGIAPATVRKHLEHAYAKLDVSTRTAAAARTAEGRQLHEPTA